MSAPSNPLTTGPHRAPARAMLKAVGFSDSDLKKPLIGVANTWIEIGPCNYHLRDLAVHVKEGIRRGGGTPMEFNTVSISDGITMGTEGMRASLVSREVIADSIELVTRGNGFDGLVILVGCDKTIPAAAMALARLNVPGLVLYGGSIAPGHWHNRAVTIQDVFEAVGANAAGTLSDGELLQAGRCGVPGRGRLRRAVHRQHDGHRQRVPGDCGAGQRQRAGDRSGEGRHRAHGGGAGDGPGARRRQAARHHHAAVARERDRVGRDNRGIDQRRPASDGDRARGWSRSVARRLRSHQRARAAARGPETVRPLRRDRAPRRGRQPARGEAAGRSARDPRIRADGDGPVAGAGSCRRRRNARPGSRARDQQRAEAQWRARHPPRDARARTVRS